MRFTLGAAVTLVYMAARREPLGISRHEIRSMLVLGVLFSVQLAMMNIGQDLTSAGHGIALNSTMPIWTATIATILIPSERLSRWQIAAMALSYLGVLAVVFGDTGISAEGVTVFGDVLSLAAAMLLGYRIILISNFAQRVSEGKLMLGQLAIGFLLLLVGSYLFEAPEYTGASRFWFALCYQGIVIAGIGFLGNAWLVKRYLPSSIAFFYFIQPVAGVTLAWLVLGEEPGRGLIAGVALVCVGALAYSWDSYRRARDG